MAARPTSATRGTLAAKGVYADAKKVTAVDQIIFAINAASVDAWMYVANQKVKVTGIVCDYTVAGGSGAAAKVRKVTAAATAPGASAGATVKELQQAAFDLTATANTPQTATLVTTAADLILSPGDKLGVDMAGTLTNLAGGAIVVTIEPTV